MKTTQRQQPWMHWIAALIAPLCVVASGGTAAVPTFYAYNHGTSNLVSFTSAAPGTFTRSVGTVGISAFPLALDFRLTTGELYALYPLGTTAYQLYRINLVSRYVSAVGVVGLSGVTTTTKFGMAFDPVRGSIRVVTSNLQHLLIDPDTGGGSLSFSPLAYAVGDSGEGVAPNIEHIAFSNAVPLPTTNTLYGIDTTRNALVRIGNVGVAGGTPNDSTVTTLGFLGVDATDFGGFVIDPTTKLGFAALTIGGNSNLYQINLATGAASFLGLIGGATTSDIRELALVPEVDPCLDIDGDGKVLPLTDGVILLRALLGLRGDTVMAGATASPAPARTRWIEIRNHMNTNCRMNFAP